MTSNPFQDAEKSTNSALATAGQGFDNWPNYGRLRRTTDLHSSGMSPALEVEARQEDPAQVHSWRMLNETQNEPNILLYDYSKAAAALSLTRPALRDLVYKGRGPRVTKIGRRTFFRREDLEEFVVSLASAQHIIIGPSKQR